MESTKQEIRHILRFYYLRGKNTTKAAEKFVKFMGPILYRFAQHSVGSIDFVLV